jgi:hypothetical protein
MRSLDGESQEDNSEQTEQTAAPPAPNDLPIAWLYGTASAAVARFLHGNPLPPDEFGEEPRRLPISRRAVGLDGSALTVTTLPPVGEPLTSQPDDNSSPSLVAHSGSGSGASPSSVSGTGWSTIATTPASSSPSYLDSAISAAPHGLPFAFTEPFESAPSRPDPFAYMDNAEPPVFGVSPATPPSSGTTSWGADAALLAHPLFAGEVPPHLTRPVPPYTHAYVSFGAGAMQKDVDQFTANHPLDDGVVPYHVPLCVYLLFTSSGRKVLAI